MIRHFNYLNGYNFNVFVPKASVEIPHVNLYQNFQAFTNQMYA